MLTCLCKIWLVISGPFCFPDGGLRGHNDNQIRPLKPDDRPETTKENARWETVEEDALTENKRDWGSRMGWDVPGSIWELGERLTLE